MQDKNLLAAREISIIFKAFYLSYFYGQNLSN